MSCPPSLGLAGTPGVFATSKPELHFATVQFGRASNRILTDFFPNLPTEISPASVGAAVRIVRLRPRALMAPSRFLFGLAAAGQPVVGRPRGAFDPFQAQLGFTLTF